MGRHLAANGLTLLIVALVGMLLLLSWGTQQYKGEGPLARAVCLQVEPGSNMRGVSEELTGMGAISNPMIFRVAADYTGREDDLKAGSFLLQPGASMATILDIITRGGQSTCGTEIVYRVGVRDQRVEVREVLPATGNYEASLTFDPREGAAPAAYRTARGEVGVRYRVVMAEGVTVADLARALQNADFLTGEPGPLPPEGMLAPDSYEVRAGDSLAGLIERMRAAQAARLAQAWESRAEDLPLESPQELLTLASIIEKETGVAEERGVIAGVFVNRLEQGMRLQTDPTIIYGITRGEGLLDRPIRRSDIDGVTERRMYGEIAYNTYQIGGLPAGPIANPGIAALTAAARPDETDYLYFVADGTGGHAFGVTAQEHNRNVAEYRRLQREQEN